MLCLVYPMNEEWGSSSVSMLCLVYSMDEEWGNRSVCCAWFILWMRSGEVEVCVVPGLFYG